MKKIFINIKNKQGFTLVELIVGIAVMVILLSALFAMLYSGFKQSQYVETHVETERTARYLVDKVVQDLRFADTMQVINDTNTNTIGFRDIRTGQYFLYIYNKVNDVLYKQSATYNTGSYTASGVPQPITGLNITDITGNKKSSNILITSDSGTDIFTILPPVGGRNTGTLLIDIVATDGGMFGQQGYVFKTKTVVSNIGNVLP